MYTRSPDGCEVDHIVSFHMNTPHVVQSLNPGLVVVELKDGVEQENKGQKFLIKYSSLPLTEALQRSVSGPQFYQS